MTKDLALDFEIFLRYELPKLLNLSPSKRVAMQLKFGRFRNYTDSLAKEMPKDFEMFFEAMRKATEAVSIFRPPRGYRTVPYWEKGSKEARYMLGKTILTTKR